MSKGKTVSGLLAAGLLGCAIGFLASSLQKSDMQQTETKLASTDESVQSSGDNGHCTPIIKNKIVEDSDVLTTLSLLPSIMETFNRIEENLTLSLKNDLTTPCLEIDTQLKTSLISEALPSTWQKFDADAVFVSGHMCSRCTALFDELESNLKTKAESAALPRVLHILLPEAKDWKSTFLSHAMKCSLEGMDPAKIEDATQASKLISEVARIGRFGPSREDVNPDEYELYTKLMTQALEKSEINDKSPTCLMTKEQIKAVMKKMPENESLANQIAVMRQPFLLHTEYAYLLHQASMPHLIKELGQN